MAEPRWIIDGYEEWLAREGLPVVGGLAVDLNDVDTVPWPRMGVDATMVHLDARGDFCNLYVCDIPGGGSSTPIHHLYEAVVYVLDGTGSTRFEVPGSEPLEFEWGPGSLFAIPLNVRYRFYNASGRRRARLACVTNLPMVMKLFRNDSFVFDVDFPFPERLGDPRFVRGEGNFIPVREHRHMWETNLVPNLLAFDELRESPGRGKGSTNIQFVLGDGTLHAHASEIPAGYYKKAHVHGEGYHIIQLSGQGYSLYWFDGEEPQRVDWQHGLLHSPQRGMWHQHFNVSDAPARYMAVSLGSIRYPYLQEKVEVLHRHYNQRSQFQIEYEDEDPAIPALFEAEREKYRAGAASSAVSP